MATSTSTATVVLVLIAMVTSVLSQSEGDVRLVKADSLPVNVNYLGRLDIFWKGKWSTFCGLDRGGAQAACRQLGFLDFDEAKPYDTIANKSYVPRADDDMPIAIRNTSCGYTYPGGLNHVLRCGYTTDTTGCNHNRDMVVKCRRTSLWVEVYDSQVRVKSGDYPSSGSLEIYYNNEWGNVCNSEFDQNSADSACRQMEYTNAKAITTTTTQSSDQVWLNGVECGNSSCMCLNRCFDNAPNEPTTCGNNNYVSINCTFDVSIADKDNQGNESVCNSPGTCNGGSASGGDGYVFPIVPFIILLVFLLAVAFVVTCIVVVCCLVSSCPLAKWLERRRYGTI